VKVSWRGPRLNGWISYHGGIGPFVALVMAGLDPAIHAPVPQPSSLFDRGVECRDRPEHDGLGDYAPVPIGLAG
jgi:hypothetical protein